MNAPYKSAIAIINVHGAFPKNRSLKR